MRLNRKNTRDLELIDFEIFDLKERISKLEKQKEDLKEEEEDLE